MADKTAKVVGFIVIPELWRLVVLVSNCDHLKGAYDRHLIDPRFPNTVDWCWLGYAPLDFHNIVIPNARHWAIELWPMRYLKLLASLWELNSTIILCGHACHACGWKPPSIIAARSWPLLIHTFRTWTTLSDIFDYRKFFTHLNMMKNSLVDNLAATFTLSIVEIRELVHPLHLHLGSLPPHLTW